LKIVYFHTTNYRITKLNTMSTKHKETRTNPNDYAFSKSAFYHPDGNFDLPENGLTKREYFAAMAMQGLLAADIANTPKQLAKVVQVSIIVADELINTLNEKSHEQR